MFLDDIQENLYFSFSGHCKWHLRHKLKILFLSIWFPMDMSIAQNQMDDQEKLDKVDFPYK